MIRTDKQHFPHNMHGGLFACCVLASFALILSPPNLLLPGTILISLLIIKHLRCAYITESFTECMSYMLALLLGFFFTLSYATASALAHHYLHTPLAISLTIGAIAPLTHIIQYIHALSREKATSPFKIDRNRVETTYPTNNLTPQKHLLIAGACVGLTSLLFPYLEKLELSFLFFGGASLLAYAYIFYYMRNAIAGLKILKQHQTQKNVTLTFFNLEEIIELRRSSWIGRGLNRIFNTTH